MASKPRPSVLVSALEPGELTHVPPIGQESLRKYFDLVTVQEVKDDPGKLYRIEGVALYGWLTDTFVQIIPKLKNLRAICGLGAGVDRFFDKISIFHVPIANTPDAVTDATADFAMGLLLNVGCDIQYGIELAMKELPPQKIPFTHKIYGVCRLTLGIVGLGRIGTAVAHRAKGFGMKIFYHSRGQKSIEKEQEITATYCSSLDEMLPVCDFVMICCPLNEETRFMFRMEQFKKMKKTACLINIARGEILDQEALIEALSCRMIHKAALDVTYPEPLPEDHPLLKLPNVIITPHMAVMTQSCLKKIFDQCAENLAAALIHGKPMPNEIKK